MSKINCGLQVMARMGQLRIVMAIATLLLWNSVECFSHDNDFSSVLKTRVSGPITPQFHIFGRNGYCAHAHLLTILKVMTCGNYPDHETYQFYSDGTLRLTSGLCLKPSTFSEGSTIITTNCASPPASETLWKLLPGDRQIMHQATGLVLTAIGAAEHIRLTLEANLYSVAQTWRLDTKEPVSSAQIIGLDDLCLHLSLDTQVWLGVCGSVGAGQK